MSAWMVLVLALTGFLLVSVVVGLALGAMLGRACREMSTLLDYELSERERAAGTRRRRRRETVGRKVSAPAA